ncbi:choice-of-anchor P family protein [Streptomyces marispadix]|uniref:Peptidoglycan DD-metalloendopeptidase family protein n=1 Tax=Streptomyces marispadix TaxID=2922868 RepID=A0ABS9T2N6_9ACTN|nr:choice-of-anchor P family protein [Streptomyces marispadix]MCH6162794.1 peptidoglycan DD-metalloendopeptidase family protein [Streptomyces marispadix]
MRSTGWGVRGTLTALITVAALAAGPAATADAATAGTYGPAGSSGAYGSSSASGPYGSSGAQVTLDAPDFKAPFECGTKWTYATYEGHGEGDLALDFNTGSGPDGDLGLPALASAGGTAHVATDSDGGGKYVEIDHGGGWVSGVFHLQKQTVKDGEKVKQGQQIGKVGDTTGNGSDLSPHLHYQVKLDGRLQKIELEGKKLYPYPYEEGKEFLTSTNGCDGDDPDEPQEPKKTELAYTGAKSASNGSPAKLAAELTDEDGDPVDGRTVGFTLGTGDSKQKCDGKTGSDGRASCEIDPVRQKLTEDGTVPVTARFAGDDEYEASKKSAKLKLEYVSGRAFGLSANAPLGLPVSVEPTPDTGEVRTAGEESKSPPCAQNIRALVLSADALCAEVTTKTGPGKVTATATLAKAGIELPGLPVVGLSGVRSTSTSTCEASSGSVDLELTVLGESVDTGDTPNLEVDLGVVGAKLVVNERITTDDGGLTVNAAHLTAPGGIDVVIGSSSSTAHNCT